MTILGAGLTSIGSHGFFQIDEENPSLVFVSKGVTVAYSMLDAIFSTAVFTCNSFPAVFIRPRSEEHTSELQSLMRISYAVFCLKKKIFFIFSFFTLIFSFFFF